MVLRSVTLFTIAFLALFSCSSESRREISNELVSSGIASIACDSTSYAWKAFLESSDDGLWEGDNEHFVSYNNIILITDPEAVRPVVYNPFAICSFGDTIYISDAATQKILAIDKTGNLLWEAGGHGEGPGEFPSVSTLTASSQYVVALNNHLSRIEFFYRDGVFSHSLVIPGAQDITTINDTTFVVGSTYADGGDLHIITSTQNTIQSFGEAPLNTYTEIPRSDLMRLCYNGYDRVAVFNRYEGLLAIYDITTEECVFEGRRNYPMTIQPPTPIGTEGRHRHTPIGGNCFLGSEGMINVVIPNVMNDSTFISTPEYLDYAPITAIDRYDWDGNYLDSYCLPDSCINYVTMISDDTLAVLNYKESSIKIIFSE